MGCLEAVAIGTIGLCTAMTSMLYPYIALLASLAILLTGGGLLGTLLAVRMDIEAFPTQIIGVVMACYSVGFVIAAMTLPRIISQVGHIRTFAVLAGLAAGSTVLYPLLIDPVVWALMRGVFGFSVAGLYMVTESWLNDRTPREFRGQILAFYSITTYAALGGGQFLLNLYPARGFELFNAAALLFALALLPVALTRSRSPEIAEARPVGLKKLHDASPMALLGSCVAGVVAGGFLGMGPVFAKGAGFSLGQVSLLMGMTILGGLLLQWPIGRLSDRYNRRVVLAGVAGVVTMASVLIALLVQVSPLLVILLATVWGGFAFTMYPLSLSLIGDFVNADEMVGASAGLLLVHGIGMIIGPVAGGYLMDRLGSDALFWGIALSALLLAVYGLWRQRVGETIIVADQGEYVTVPSVAVAPIATALDPRSEEVQLEFDFGGESHSDVVNSAHG